MPVALLALGILVGAAVQRVTGLGFGLISGPLLVLAAGPFDGVTLTNILALASNLIVLTMVWPDIDLRRTLLLAGPAVLAVPFGAAMARAVPGGVLSVIVGCLVLAALVTVLLVHSARVVRGRAGAVAAGVVSGFMSVTAAVGGPALTVYAVSTDWRDKTFPASLQLYFAIVNVAAITAKGPPGIDTATWLLAGVALLAGTLLGQLLARRVTSQQAFPYVVALAIAGALATIIKGVAALTSGSS